MSADSATETANTRFSAPQLNRLREADSAAHRWYRFVLSYPPHFVQYCLNRFSVGTDQRVLDPFCGTGTTVVECKKQGVASAGIEANAMAWFAGQTKLDWSASSAQISREADRVQAIAAQEIARPQPLRTLPAEQHRLLLKNSISPWPLHKTLILLEAIDQGQSSVRDRLKLALAKALTTDIGNLRFGPEVGVGKPKDDAPVIASWRQAVTNIAADLDQLPTPPLAAAHVHRADARQCQHLIAPTSIDAVITSPPYPNEKDYTRTTRLESVLLGFIRTRQELRDLKQGLLRSNTRNVYKADDDDRWVADHAGIQAIAAQIEARRLELGKTSGFERLYPRAVTLYFGGMARHLAELRSLLRPGAYLAYLVGDQKSYLQVLIQTGELLGQIAVGLGYELIDIELFRTRAATATREQLREEVVILRWPGPPPTQPYPYWD